MRSSLSLAAALILAGCATTREASAPALPLAIERYGALKPSQVRNLVVVLHDDLTPGAPVDYSGFAARAAAAVPAGGAVVVLRPGYADADGHLSGGIRARGIGDGYSAEQIRLVGETVQALAARYRNARTILIGDGGGAVLAANVAAMRPSLVHSLLLIGCPCALPEWRKHMARREPAFAESVDSLDPLQTVGGIAPTARIAIVAGGDKARVPARIARLYAEALALRGIAVEYRQVEGDDLLAGDEVTQLLGRLAEGASRAEPRT
jgi:pimeloyl-ACP methyl ester carboxylesterase